MALRSVRIFTESSKPEGNDHRLVVLNWKRTDKNPKPHSSVCVSIPNLTITTEPALLSKALTASFHEMQEAIIRRDVEKLLSSKQQLPFTLDDADYNFEGVAIFAESEATSKRLSKETIAAWFDHNLRDNLTIKLATDHSIDDTNQEQLDKLTRAVSNYRSVFITLAAPTTHLQISDAKKLHSNLSAADNQEDPIFQSIEQRLSRMLQPAKEALAELL